MKRSSGDLKSARHRTEESFYAESGKSVAIIGAGPVGIAAAHELALLGHRVVTFEAQEKPGGMLRYGIPEFRLPRNLLDEEISQVTRLGIEIKTGQEVGKNLEVSSLLSDYDAVVLATGCMKSTKAGIPGEDLGGVISGLDFVMDVNNGIYPEIGKRVAVIGGGYTTIDCARLAVR